MPEYLSPGVYVEEVPPRLRAIEGVSTSTAGFVGPAQRGPVAGLAPTDGVEALADDFTLPDGFELPTDPTPVLVTSFAEFRRIFGPPPDDPARRGYLAHAVRAFFDNGGRRAFIARAASADAQRASIRVGRGPVLRLARPARAGDESLFLTSLRGVNATGDNAIQILRASDDAVLADVTVSAYDTRSGLVTLGAPLAAGIELDPERVYAVPETSTPDAGTGPMFIARDPGSWGGRLEVLVTNSDRPPVEVAAPIAAVATDRVQVRSTSSFYPGALVEIDHGGNTTREYATVAEILPGQTLRLGANVSNVAATGFVRVVEIDVTINDRGLGTTETFRNLSWNGDPDPAIRRRHYATIINGRSRLVYVLPPWADLGGGDDEDPPTLANQPMSTHGFAQAPASPDDMGADGTISTDPTSTFNARVVGEDAGPGRRTGIQSLQDVEDIRIVAAPGCTAAEVQNALVTHCERMRYRFAVLDGEREPAGPSVVNAMLAHRNAYDSSHAALYVPWVTVTVEGRPLPLPPSGHVVGIYARTDNERGVHKAPANEVVRNVTGLQSYITTGEQDLLNPRGVNAIRRLEGRGIRVWGARTLSSDPAVRYVNVRRFLIFVEASIDRGTQHVVFEPNSPETWSRVVDSVSAFLNTQWREGALLGRRPEDAFFVRCDESTMTIDDIQNGRLICEIGIAIVRPAEFVIFRIEQIAGLGQD